MTDKKIPSAQDIIAEARRASRSPQRNSAAATSAPRRPSPLPSKGAGQARPLKWSSAPTARPTATPSTKGAQNDNNRATGKPTRVWGEGLQHSDRKREASSATQRTAQNGRSGTTRQSRDKNSTDNAAATPQRTKNAPAPKQGAATQASGTQQAVTSIEPKKKKARRRMGGFSVFVTMWCVAIIVASAVLSLWGYTVYKDAHVDVERTEAYQQGVSDSTSPKTVASVIRLSEEELSSLITSSPGATFPAGSKLTKFNLIGWSVPYGTENKGTAKVEFCYTGKGVDNPLYATAYVISDNAQKDKPRWAVDSTSITGDKCSDRIEK